MGWNRKQNKREKPKRPPTGHRDQPRASTFKTSRDKERARRPKTRDLLDYEE